jgi:hypothetical protein
MSLRAKLLLGLLPAALPLLAAAPAGPYQYPTSERVIYVDQCIRDNPGPYYEMVAKCSCALDHIAKTTPYDDFVNMQTATNASTIGGERGNAVRDAQGISEMVRAFRDLQTKARQVCLFDIASPK